MALSFNLTNSVKSSGKSDGNYDQLNDNKIAKSIIDILFKATENIVKNDNEMNGFTKSLTLSSLPGVRNGSKNSINKMSKVELKNLLDDIQNQLRFR